MARASAALAVLSLAGLSASAAQGDDDIVTFTVCSTWDCLDGVGIDQKFESAESLTAMERYPDWVARTPIICSKPQTGAGPLSAPALKNREHDWHCRPDQWAFFRNADKECGGSAGLFDALPERYIDRNFCPWSSYLHKCVGCEPMDNLATNGSYLVHFYKNATEYMLELAANKLGLLGANITNHIAHYGPYGETYFITMPDANQPEAETLPGVHTVIYDLPF